MRLTMMYKKTPGRASPGGEEGREERDLRGADGATRGDGSGNDRGLHRLHNLRPCRGARHVARLDHEALLERRVDARLNVVRLLTHHFRNLGDDQRLGTVEHALLAERETLGFAEEREALEDIGHVVDGAGAHLVRVVLETAFPILMIVDLAVAQEVEQPLDLFVRNGLAKADVVDVGDGNEHGRVVCHDPQVKKSAGSTKNCLFFNAFDDTEPVVRVYDLVADLKCHVSPVAGRLWKDRPRDHSPTLRSP